VLEDTAAGDVRQINMTLVTFSVGTMTQLPTPLSRNTLLVNTSDIST
jgi:hypothetical protein